MHKFSYFVIFILTIEFTNAEHTLQCGEWDVFKDEKCIKVFDNKDVENYSDAINKCYQTEGSSLVSIRSQEEQNFLFKLLQTQHSVVNDVWIGAMYRQNGLVLTDNTTVNFTNWANGYPRNDSGYDCVQMSIVEPYHGQWLNTPCNKNNVVVCQKPQNWLFSYLQKTVMDLRESFENITKQLTNTNLELENTKLQLKNEEKNSNELRESLLTTKQELQQEIIKRSIESALPGTIAYFAITSAPMGWLKANGQSVSRTTYSNLFALIGTLYGSGDGSTTFTLPDLRGEFIRSWSDGRDIDKNRTFGSFQWGSSIPYSYQIDNRTDIATNFGYFQSRAFAGTTFDGGFQYNITFNQTRDGITFNGWNNVLSDVHYIDATKIGRINNWNLMSGTRPRNIALLACIKY